MTTVVVITSASAGIGRATALEFARQGCSMGILAGEPQPDNLFEPVPGEYDAQGRFSGRAKTSMPQLLLAMHRAKLQWAAVAIAVVTITVALT